MIFHGYGHELWAKGGDSFQEMGASLTSINRQVHPFVAYAK